MVAAADSTGAVADSTAAVEGSTAAALAVEHFTARVPTAEAELTAAAASGLAGITEATLTAEAPMVLVDTTAAWVRTAAALLLVRIVSTERLVVLAAQHGHPVPTTQLPMAAGTPLVTRAGLPVWEPLAHFITTR
jgi:hypothetical protein